jgi:hypothetical protein
VRGEEGENNKQITTKDAKMYEGTPETPRFSNKAEIALVGLGTLRELVQSEN